jgi:hypothetical protein
MAAPEFPVVRNVPHTAVGSVATRTRYVIVFKIGARIGQHSPVRCVCTKLTNNSSARIGRLHGRNRNAENFPEGNLSGSKTIAPLKKHLLKS